jgi:hypothetical protein
MKGIMKKSEKVWLVLDVGVACREISTRLCVMTAHPMTKLCPTSSPFIPNNQLKVKKNQKERKEKVEARIIITS